MIEGDLRRAALAGYPARLEVEGEEMAVAIEGVLDRDVTILRLGQRSVSMRPSPALAERMPLAVAREMLARWVDPYLAVQDRRGAARAASRAYLEMLRERAGVLGAEPLPPILPPDPSPRDSGWPWTLTTVGLALAGSALVLRHRRHG